MLGIIFIHNPEGVLTSDISQRKIFDQSYNQLNTLHFLIIGECRKSYECAREYRHNFTSDNKS